MTGARNDQDQKDYLEVAGLATAVEQFLTRGLWPGANGWERAGGEVATPADLPRLAEVLRALSLQNQLSPRRA